MELCYRNNSNSLLKKYAFLVTWFANTKEGRQLLKLPKLNPIDLFLPNGYREIEEIKEKQILYKSTFYTKAVYSPILYPALQYLDVCVGLGIVTDAQQAKIIFLSQLGLTTRKKRNIYVPQVFLTTTTAYPDADPETTTVDGYTEAGNTSAIWATKRSEAGGGATANTLVEPRLRCSTTTDQFDRWWRGIALFDASSIPDTDNISAALVGLTADAGNILATLNLNINICSSSPASNTALAAGDHAIANFGGTLFATGIAAGSLTADGSTYNNFNLVAAGLAAISKTSITKFGVLTENDIQNSAPTWSSLTSADAGFNSADSYAGTTKDPKLVVTHAEAPGVGGPSGYKSLLGVGQA